MDINKLRIGDYDREHLRYYDSATHSHYRATLVRVTEKRAVVDLSWQKGKHVDPANLTDSPTREKV
jgi:hypothetical protein